MKKGNALNQIALLYPQRKVLNVSLAQTFLIYVQNVRYSSLMVSSASELCSQLYTYVWHSSEMMY